MRDEVAKAERIFDRLVARVVIAAVIDGRREVVAALESRLGLGFPDIR